MKVAQEAKELQAKGENVIDLSVGEPDFPTPQNIKNAAIRAIENNFTKYTLNAGTIELRKAIAEKLKKENGLDYSPNEIIVSAGAKQSIYNAVQALIYNDDEAIIAAPYWVSYPEIVTLAHGKPVIVNASEENGFKLTAQQISEAVTPQTKLLILCNPCNPTGAAYSKKELEEIAEVVEEKKLFVISDEIYEKLVYDDFKFVSFASLSEKIKSRTIVVNGLSKAYSMTGWRIGYAAASQEIINALNKIQSHSTSNASSISQAAAVEALIGPQDSLEVMRKEFERRRNFLYDSITSIEGIKCHKPEGAFYLFPNVSEYFNKSTHVFKITNSFDLAMYLLYEEKIATVPGSAFGAEGYIRISYSTSMEQLEEGARRLKEAFKKMSV
ncbi:MAG: pyridoxal phosphate-dependent aminotransferase [Ignavibacteriales bacterium]|nr:pyridoxal phosphate-dependent aminotransferase [Ignavibacteriales bacterium]